MTAGSSPFGGVGPVRLRRLDDVSTEEIAAVLAALTRREDEGVTGYDRWRAGRLTALRQRPRLT